MSGVKIEISQDKLQATVEAMRDLVAYYESDAVALARLGAPIPNRLADDRLQQAEVARDLLTFFGRQ